MSVTGQWPGPRIRVPLLPVAGRVGAALLRAVPGAGRPLAGGAVVVRLDVLAVGQLGLRRPAAGAFGPAVPADLGTVVLVAVVAGVHAGAVLEPGAGPVPAHAARPLGAPGHRRLRLGRTLVLLLLLGLDGRQGGLPGRQLLLGAGPPACAVTRRAGT